MMPIYCDHNATTPLRAEVLAAMLPFLREHYGNASSVHAYGAHARGAIEDARTEVAALIGAPPAEVVFTSGGTESNNLAIHGVARAAAPGAIVTSAIEHASVRESAAALERDGYCLCTVGVDELGRVLTSELEALLANGAVNLVSIGWANNEVGTIQSIGGISTQCRLHGVLLHVDAVQAAGKIPVHVTGIDLLSLSAHKLGGPQGVGALYVRTGVELRPLLFGGHQERERRAGTENVAGIVGMGMACRLAAAELGTFAACAALRERLWAGLSERITGVVRNSPTEAECLPNTLNVSFDEVRGEALVAALDLQGVAVSGGSACAAGAGEPSHVLMALGRSAEAARDGVRFSLGRTTTLAEVEHVIVITAAAVQRIRGAHRERRRA